MLQLQNLARRFRPSAYHAGGERAPDRHALPDVFRDAWSVPAALLAVNLQKIALQDVTPPGAVYHSTAGRNAAERKAAQVVTLGTSPGNLQNVNQEPRDVLPVYTAYIKLLQACQLYGVPCACCDIRVKTALQASGRFTGVNNIGNAAENGSGPQIAKICKTDLHGAANTEKTHRNASQNVETLRRCKYTRQGGNAAGRQETARKRENMQNRRT